MSSAKVEAIARAIVGQDGDVHTAFSRCGTTGELIFNAGQITVSASELLSISESVAFQRASVINPQVGCYE